MNDNKKIVKEYEQVYDPSTGYSRDDEGNVWKGKPNSKYNVGTASVRPGGRSFNRSYSTPKKKEIPEDKIYIGREAKDKSTLLYFIYQTIGLLGFSLTLPSRYKDYSFDDIDKDALRFIRQYFNDDTITNIKVSFANRGRTPDDIRKVFIRYY